MADIATTPVPPRQTLRSLPFWAWWTLKSHWTRFTSPITPFVPRNILNFSAFILALYIIPFAIMTLRPGTPALANHMLAGIVVISIAIFAFSKGYTLQELGIRRDTLLPAMLTAGGFATFIVVLNVTGSIKGWFPTYSQHHYGIVDVLYYALLSAPGQEFIYRSFLFALMKRAGLTDIRLQVFLSAFTFTFLHIQHHSWLILAVTFPLGIIWALIYRKWPNFWAATLSHGLVGTAALLTRFV